MKVITLEQLLKEEDPGALIETMSFESGLKMLEELVAKVESGAMPLDLAVSSYEKGTLIMNQLRKLLSGAEEKLRLLEKR